MGEAQRIPWSIKWSCSYSYFLSVMIWILRKQDVQISCLWNIIGDCCLSATSAFDSWSDRHLSSPTHLHGTGIAEVTEPPGCVSRGQTCGVSSARTGHCGQDMASHISGKRLQGDIPSFGYARQRHLLRTSGKKWRAEFQWSQTLPSLGLGDSWEISFGNDCLRFKCLLELG